MRIVILSRLHIVTSRVQCQKIVQFQIIQFSISTQFKCKYGLIVKRLLFQAIQFTQTVLIQTIQFRISMQLVLFDP